MRTLWALSLMFSSLLDLHSTRMSARHTLTKSFLPMVTSHFFILYVPPLLLYILLQRRGVHLSGLSVSSSCSLHALHVLSLVQRDAVQGFDPFTARNDMYNVFFFSCSSATRADLERLRDRALVRKYTHLDKAMLNSLLIT